MPQIAGHIDIRTAHERMIQQAITRAPAQCDS